MKHTPVYKEEFLKALNVVAGGKYIDATYGQGGYTQALVDAGAHVLALDADKRQVELAAQSFDPEKAVIVHGNYAQLEELAAEHSFYPVDGVIFDLGLSFEQMMNAKRGFSYKNTEDPLDMRLDAEEDTATAQQLLSKKNEDELYEIFSHNGEELSARALAAYIVRTRHEHPYHTVGDLLYAISAVVQYEREKSFSRVFQSLRMAVNHELDRLRQGIAAAIHVLKPQGVIVVLTFHSVEDRLVKRLLQSSPLLDAPKRVVKKQPLPFERSAILRVAVKKS